MGHVFVAQKDGSAEVCVLKLLNTEAEGDDSSAQRLRREAHLLALMNHPHISRVLDAGFEEGAFFIALEFIPGQTVNVIQQHLRRNKRRIPPEVTMALALDVLSGLDYAHDHPDPDGNPIHLVHRDLSPNNIMLSYSGDAKIIDFGIASGKIDTFKTKPGHIMGTPRYLSPEQATMKPVDRRSDIYTLSVVLYGMFRGRPMINKGPPGQVLSDIVEKTPRPLSEVITDFPEEIWHVLHRGLQKDPTLRWQTAEEYRNALAQAHPWTLPERTEIGLFLEQYFPEGKTTAQTLLERGRANAPAVVQPGGFFDTTGIDIPLPKKKASVTEPEIVPEAPGANIHTDLIDRPGDDAKTAEIVREPSGVAALHQEVAIQQASEMDSGPTVANDPRDFPPGILDVPIEKRSVDAHMARRDTDPNAKALPASPKWPWAIALLFALVLGIGAGVIFNLLE